MIQQIQQIRNQQQNIERLKRQVTSLQSNASQKGNIVRAELAAMPADVEIPELIKAKLVYDPERQMLLWMDNVITPDELKVLDGLTSDPDLRAAIQEIVQTISVVPTSLDVLQLLNTLANANNNLRSQERGLQDGLDTFKISLGLPPDLTLTIDDSMLEPFMFIDPQLSALETEITDYVPNSWSRIDEQAPSQEQLQLANNELDQLVNRVQTEVLAILDQDVANLNGSMEKILGRMDSVEEQERLKTDVGRDLRSLEAARNRLVELRRSTQQISEAIENAGNAPADVVPPADPANEDEDSGEKLTPQQELRLEILSVHQDLLQIIRNLTVVQAGLRVDQIVVPEFTIPMEEVVQHAVENRVDLMNLRATVVDARRKVEIAGNLLQSNVDVIVDGDIRNSGGNRPFDFQGDRSQIRAGLRFTAPLDQIQERNVYRSTLINYQRARRDYLALEDAVKNQVRRNWRQLSVLKRNVDTSRLALRLAAKQYESAVDESTAPAPVGGGSGSRSGGLQGTNLTNALNSIISAQNSLIGFWVAYEQNRLGIYRDMGMMEIGPDGIWNDPVYRGSLDQDTQEGLPARQTLPDGGPDDGQPEAIPTPLDADGLGARRDRRSRDGGSGEAAGVVFAADGEFEGGLLRFSTKPAEKKSFLISLPVQGNLDSQGNAVLSSAVEGTTTIISIVPEGTMVEKDQVVCELDSSALREKAKQQEITVTQADSAMAQANEKLQITKTQNESDIAAAQLKLDLALLDLKKYRDGEYLQQQKEMKGNEEIAREELVRAKENYDFTKTQVKKDTAPKTKWKPIGSPGSRRS